MATTTSTGRAGLPGGDTRSGTRLYHPKEQDGRTFRPAPSPEQLARLSRAGWVDTPAKLPGYTPPETAGPGLDGIEEADFVSDDAAQPVERVARAARAGAASGEPSIDIRTIPVGEAAAIIAKVSDPVVLSKILQREKGSSKPKGGRRAVIEAIADRLADLA